MTSRQRQLVIQYGLMAVTVLPLLLAVVKMIQLLYFYDEAAGMLQTGGGAAVLQGIVNTGALITAAAGILLAVNINQVLPRIRLGQPMIMGIALFAAGLFFLGQCMADLWALLSEPPLKIGGPEGDVGYLQVVVSVFGFVTAGAMITMAYGVIAAGKRPHPLLGMLPACWGVLFMLNLLLTYENLVSMQNDVVKTIAGLLAMLFLYYYGRSICRLDGKEENRIGIFVRTVFPGLGFLTAAPYCVAFVCGIRDWAGNMPYLALAGLSLFAGTALMQLCTVALTGLSKKDLQ